MKAEEQFTQLLTTYNQAQRFWHGVLLIVIANREAARQSLRYLEIASA
jgi:hypothetical protein